MKVSASGVSLRGNGRLLVNWVRHQEAVVLFAALIVVLALFVFIKITAGMVHGDSREFDEGCWLVARYLQYRGKVEPPGPVRINEGAPGGKRQDIDA